MGDEKKPDQPQGDAWKMPEPIFRSSPGKTPKKLDLSQEEVPTEPGFSEMETEEDVAVPSGVIGSEPSQGVRPSTKIRVRHKKKGGCAKLVLTLIGLVAAAVIIILGAMVYLLFYYRAPETAF
ncbi:MAG: hypothetical protein JO053_09350 [Acidobacteria bacterium]|nr:hypothetical protein [Acidobacteriota bacterium]